MLPQLLGYAEPPSYISRPNGQVAQLVEQRTENPRVGGSIPSLAIGCNSASRCATGSVESGRCRLVMPSRSLGKSRTFAKLDGTWLVPELRITPPFSLALNYLTLFRNSLRNGR